MTAFDLRAAIGFCWLAFVVVWLLAAANTKRTAERPGNQLGYRLIWIAAFALLYLSRPGRNALGPLGTVILPADLALVGFGLVMTIAGLALAFWARATLGRNWSGTIQFKQDHTLVQTGPYAVVRHPIYTAILLMFVGTALAYGTLAAVVAVPLAVVSFIVKARREEELMQQHFPDDYAAYRKRTRMIVPLVF
jgi:protein-S-isoprenylcysteine O-methyltransferase Ste14